MECWEVSLPGKESPSEDSTAEAVGVCGERMGNCLVLAEEAREEHDALRSMIREIIKAS